MRNFLLPSFNPVAAGQTASLKIPKWAFTLQWITLRFGGTTMSKALISRIALKIGSKTAWQVNSFAGVAAGTILDRMNQAMNIYADANRLSIPLFDRNMETGPLKEIGGWDLTKFSDDVFLEVDIAAGAVAPTLSASAYWTQPQGKDPKNPASQLITKVIAFPYSFAAGGTFSLPFEPKGALVKRIYMQYAGANGTATSDGNINKFEVKKNGQTYWEYTDQENRFALQEVGKRVPQNNQYLVDFTIENNLSGALVTADAQSIDFRPWLTATDTGVAIFEVLDAPYNLTN